jgi:hypothetical protein
MTQTDMWDAKARSELLHVYPQAANHCNARICGSPDALKRLARALMDAAKATPRAAQSVQMMTADGECYDLIVEPMTDKQIDDMPLPYAQLGMPWDFDVLPGERE